MAEALIKLFHSNRVTYEGDGVTYSLSEFGGVVPSVGDVIANPRVSASLDRNRLENRDLYTVTARYFIPDGRTSRIALVVESRKRHSREANILIGWG